MCKIGKRLTVAPNPDAAQYHRMIVRFEHYCREIRKARESGDDTARQVAYAGLSATHAVYKDLFIHESVEHAMGAARLALHGEAS